MRSTKTKIFSLVLVMALVSGCVGMFHSHRSISPPEGCISCHSKPINSNWHVLFKPATIHDELDSGHGTTVAEGKPRADGQPQFCFSCHHTPAQYHRWYKGVYAH